MFIAHKSRGVTSSVGAAWLGLTGSQDDAVGCHNGFMALLTELCLRSQFCKDKVLGAPTQRITAKETK